MGDWQAGAFFKGEKNSRRSSLFTLAIPLCSARVLAEQMVQTCKSKSGCIKVTQKNAIILRNIMAPLI